LSGPYTIPTGWFELPELIAAATSSIPIFRLARTPGSTWTRTAYFFAP